MALSYSCNLIKPDGIERGLIGKIISRFEARGLSLVDMKWLLPTEQQIRAMYEDKQTYSIFEDILAYLVDKPVIAMIWAGEDANEKARQIIGLKDPLESDAGTIRGGMASDKVHNLVHGSRTPEEAWAEIQILFPSRFGAEPVKETPKDFNTELAEYYAAVDAENAWRASILFGHEDDPIPALTFLKTFEPLEVP